ncbi:MAG TPA: hypothetical protein VM492_01270 [Sumerlaeia bacterium]|nr:hypothetical protein [Sumerlaeia bacterium]
MLTKKLLDEIKAFEEFHARQAEGQTRLVQQIEELERTRRQSYQVVARDNSDGLARQRLDEIDAKVEKAKKALQAHRRRTRNHVRSGRTRLLQSQEQALRDLEERSKRNHEEQAELRNVLIPEAEQHLAALKERRARAEEEIEQIRKEIERITRIDLDALFQD